MIMVKRGSSFYFPLVVGFYFIYFGLCIWSVVNGEETTLISLYSFYRTGDDSIDLACLGKSDHFCEKFLVSTIGNN